MFVIDISSCCKPYISPATIFRIFFLPWAVTMISTVTKNWSYLLHCFNFYSDADQGKNKLQPSPNPNHRQSKVIGSSFMVRYLGIIEQNQES